MPNPRIIIGNRQGSYGMWVSRPGCSAESTDNTQFLMSPQIIATQPYMTGTIYNAGTGEISTVVNHNLGYIPMVSLFCGGNNSFDNKASPNWCVITTSQLLINGMQNNEIITHYQGGYTGVYYEFIDVFYVIFRNKLASS